MDTIKSRRARAKALREKKQEEIFLKELSSSTTNQVTPTTTFNDSNKEVKTKRTRMQNCKGTSNMFIKP
jgi:hypothetical protein